MCCTAVYGCTTSVTAVCVEGGPEIIDDCRTHVKLEGKLLAGQTYVSKPGRLPCKAVIHAVGPMWHGGREDEENQLFAAVTQSMEEANQRGFRTVAIPAISTGIFNFPQNRAVDIILCACRDYLIDQSGTSLREIHIVDNDPKIIGLFETSLQSLTLPSGPGPEEGHSETLSRRVRTSAQNDEQMANDSGESHSTKLLASL